MTSASNALRARSPISSACARGRGRAGGHPSRAGVLPAGRPGLCRPSAADADEIPHADLTGHAEALRAYEATLGISPRAQTRIPAAAARRRRLRRRARRNRTPSRIGADGVPAARSSRTPRRRAAAREGRSTAGSWRKSRWASRSASSMMRSPMSPSSSSRAPDEQWWIEPLAPRRATEIAARRRQRHRRASHHHAIGQ